MKPLNRLSQIVLFPILLFFIGLLGGCNHLPPVEASSTEPAHLDARFIAPPPSLLVATPTFISEAEAETEPEQQYLSIADWLEQRRETCELPNEEIDAQLSRYRESLSTQPAEEAETQVVHAYSQLKALMLASCDPARTPGLLKNFLVAIREHSHWPSEYTALFDLLASEHRAYALLEKKYRELEALHQKTIEGIGNIESSLEDQAEPDI